MELLSEKLTWLTMVYGKMLYHKKLHPSGVSESAQNEVHTIDYVARWVLLSCQYSDFSAQEAGDKSIPSNAYYSSFR